MGGGEMKLKLCKLVRSCFDIFATITAVAAMILRENWYIPLLIAAIALLLIGIVFSAVLYRCPMCGRALPVRGKTPKACPFCGGALQ